MASWTAERVVSSELATELIASQFPQLAPITLHPFGAGWDNTAYLVNGEFVFRFPRRQLGADCLANEIRILPHLEGRVPLPLPFPEFIAFPTPDFPWPFAGYRKLAGRTACAVALDEQQRIVAAK